MAECNDPSDKCPVILRSKVLNQSEEDLDHFTCRICSGILINPVQTQCCQWLYCQQCIESELSVNNKCPNSSCKQGHIGQRALIPPPGQMVALLDNLEIKCDFFDRGCAKEMKIIERIEHIKVCAFRPKQPCPTCGLAKINKDHNCLQNLIDENQKLRDENKQLLENYSALKSESENILPLKRIFTLAMLNARPIINQIFFSLSIMFSILILSGYISYQNYESDLKSRVIKDEINSVNDDMNSLKELFIKYFKTEMASLNDQDQSIPNVCDIDTQSNKIKLDCFKALFRKLKKFVTIRADDKESLKKKFVAQEKSDSIMPKRRSATKYLIEIFVTLFFFSAVLSLVKSSINILNR